MKEKNRKILISAYEDKKDSFSMSIAVDPTKLSFSQELEYHAIRFPKNLFDLLKSFAEERSSREYPSFETKSLNNLIEFLTEIDVINRPKPGVIWLISNRKDKLIINQLEEIFEIWFNREFKDINKIYDRDITPNLNTNQLFNFEPLDFSDEQKFMSIPLLATTFLEGKENKITMCYKEKNQSFIVRFYRALDSSLASSSGIRMYTAPIHHSGRRDPFMFNMDLKLQTTPLKDLYLVITIGITIVTNKKNPKSISGIKRSVIMYRKDMSNMSDTDDNKKKIYILHTIRKFKNESWIWKWDNLDDWMVSEIKRLFQIDLPKADKIIRTSVFDQRYDFKFGLVHHSQGWNTKTRTGVSEEQRAFMFREIENRLCVNNGFSRHIVHKRYQRLMRYPKGRKQTYDRSDDFFGIYTNISDVPSSINKLEESIEKNEMDIYDDFDLRIPNSRIIVLYPQTTKYSSTNKSYEDIIKRIFILLLGKKCFNEAVQLIEMPLSSIENITQEKLKSTLQLLNLNKDTHNAILYPLYDKEYYEQNKIKDPKKQVTQLIIKYHGSAKQYSIKHNCVDLKTNVSKKTTDFESKFIKSILGLFRTLGYPRAKFKGIKFMGEPINELGIRVYKQKHQRDKYFVIATLVHKKGNLYYFLNNSNYFPYSKIYQDFNIRSAIKKQGKSEKQLSIVIKSIIKEVQQQFGSTCVYLHRAHINKNSVIKTMPNNRVLHDQILFAHDSTTTLSSDWQGIRIIRVNDTNEIPWFFLEKARKCGEKSYDGYQRSSGIIFQENLTSNNKPMMCYSIGQRLDTMQIPVSFIKQLNPSMQGHSPRTVEFTLLMYQKDDDIPQLFNLAHLSRSLPPGLSTDVKYPFCLYLVEKLRSDMKKYFEIDLDIN